MFPFLQQTELFATLRQDEIETSLHQMGAYQASFREGEHIITHLSQVRHAGILLEGKAQAIMPNYDGSESILHQYEAGMLFAEAYALHPTSPIPMDITAASDCRVLFLNLKHAEHTQLRRNLCQLMAKANMEQNLKIKILSQKHIRARLISYIRVERLADAHGVVELPFNREQLANYLGVERSALSRELSRMRDEGLLTYRKNRLTFMDKGLTHAIDKT